MMPIAFPSKGHSPTAPPISSLDSPKKASPMMLLSGGRRLGQDQRNNCLALMWPSENEDEMSTPMRANLGGAVVTNTHEHYTVEGVHGTGTLDQTTEVMVCPSGQTVVRVKATMEARLHSPTTGDKGSPSGIKHLKLPSSPNTSLQNRSRPGGPRQDSPWHHPVSGGSPASPVRFPGRSLLFESADNRPASKDPCRVQSTNPTGHVSSGEVTPLPTPSSAVKKKGARRRKISGKDKGDKSRFSGGVQGILEQDHPEEDVSSHSRCPCFKFFLLMCLLGMLLAVLFYLSLWLVAQHRGSPVFIQGGETLQTLLEMQVFGQPIVVSLLPQLLSGFLAIDNKDKTMVLMFQGQSGTGKTFVADMIKSKLFTEDSKQQCTDKFLPSYQQMKENLQSAYDYSISLEDFIDQKRGHYRTCPFIVYIIEDLDFNDSLNLVEAVADTLQSIRSRQTSEEQKLAFVLVTNIQGEEIGDYFQGQKKNGIINREEITLEEIIPILKSFPSSESTLQSGENNAKQNQNINLKEIHSKLLSVVDHHIPFLPLEREHVILCVRRILADRNLTLAQEDVEWIADKMSYYPERNPIFSSSGCKKVEEKTNLLSNYPHS